MEAEIGVGLSVVALVVGAPLMMLGLIWLLGELEAWMLEPDERAAAVQALLEQTEEADEVETAVAELLSDVAGPSQHPGPPDR